MLEKYAMLMLLERTDHLSQEYILLYKFYCTSTENMIH